MIGYSYLFAPSGRPINQNLEIQQSWKMKEEYAKL